MKQRAILGVVGTSKSNSKSKNVNKPSAGMAKTVKQREKSLASRTTTKASSLYSAGSISRPVRQLAAKSLSSSSPASVPRDSTIRHIWFQFGFPVPVTKPWGRQPLQSAALHLLETRTPVKSPPAEQPVTPQTGSESLPASNAKSDTCSSSEEESAGQKAAAAAVMALDQV